MFLTDLSIKRPVVASVMSLILVIFGLLSYQDIPTDELPNVQPPIVTIQTIYKGASAEIIDTQITQKIEDFVGGTPGLETIESFSEDESSRITLIFETGLNLDNVANDVRSSVARIVDNLPSGAETPEIFKQNAGMRTTMWLSFSSEIMSDVELTDYADRYLTDLFSTVKGVGRVRLGGEREMSLRVWLDPISLAARDLTTQEIEEALLKENVEFPAGRIESKDIDLTIQLDNAYKEVDLILGPTTPDIAFKIGEKMNDPIAMYLSDVYTVSTNLAGLPAISIPMGFKENMPLGLQIIGKHFDEENILRISHLYQKETDWHLMAPDK